MSLRASLGQVALICGCLWELRPAAGQLTPMEERGKQIYEMGVSPAKTAITAIPGGEGSEISAAMLVCASCHGLDGEGRPEGGVTPSDITWDSLTKPYEVRGQNGRRRLSYDDASLGRAITQGMDSSGNTLAAAMPRYRMSRQDLADLTAYVKSLGSTLDPGLSGESLRIGALLPSGGQMPEMSGAITRVLTAFVDNVNREGGIYNRRLEIRFAESPETPQERAAALRRFVREQQIFALIATYMVGAEDAMASAARNEKTPVVGAFALFPQITSPPNRYVFYLHPGLPGETTALAGFAIEKYASRSMRAVIVDSGETPFRQMAGSVKDLLRNAGWMPIDEISLPAEGLDFAAVTRGLEDDRPAAVFFLVPGAASDFLLQQGAKLGANQVFLLPGSLATEEVFQAPRNLDRRIFLAFATLPSDHTPQGVAEYRKLTAGYALPGDHLAAQFTALASAKILVEALNAAGRKVSRERVIDTLEKTYDFNTGFAPSYSFGPNRRIGALESHMVTADLPSGVLVPVAEWPGMN